MKTPAKKPAAKKPAGKRGRPKKVVAPKPEEMKPVGLFELMFGWMWKK